MKKVITLIALFFSLSMAHAQCPKYLAFDTSICYSGVNRTIDARVLTSRLCGDTVTVTFNDSLTSLNGSRQVYFHAGPEFRPFTGFQGAYTADSAMQKIGPHLWTIKFNPRSFFRYSADSCLNAIACGFRDSAFVHYVKDGANDIFILTYTGAATTTYPYITCSYTHNTAATYLWNDGRTDSVRLFNAGGSYTVTATGPGGCTAAGTVRIRISTARVSLGPDTTSCTGAPIQLRASSGFPSIRWNNGAYNSINTHLASKPGRYWVFAFDSNNCNSSDTINVFHTEVTAVSLPDTVRSCPGNSVGVNAAFNIDQQGDSLVITYDATLGQTQLIGDTNVYFHSGPEFRPFQGWQTLYTVGNFNSNDGVGRMTPLGNNKWRIAIVPQSYYGFDPDTPLNGIFMVFRNYNGTRTGKDGAGNDIFLNLTTSLPSSSFAGIAAGRQARQPISYAWNDGPTTAARNISSGGLYTVTVSDGHCSAVDTVVSVFSALSSINIGRDTTVCRGQRVTISAGLGYTRYAWSTGDSTASITVSNPGLYTVTVTANGGCQSLGTRRVSNSNSSVSLGNDISRCNNAPVTLTATGSNIATYSWIGRPATTSATYSAVNAGCYWVKATDSIGCISYDSVKVMNSAVAGLNVQDSVISCPGSSVPVDASVSINAVGDSLIIVYDATKGQTQLVGDTNVYFHSGPEFRPFTGWQLGYTVGSFTNNDGIGRMTSLGSNKWRIAIDPQCYYGYSPDSSLNGVFMVFRNYNGTKTGKDANGNDIFVYTAVTPPTCSFNGVTASRAARAGVSYAWTTPSGAVSGATVNVNTSGTYIVTATSGLCSKSDTLRANFINTTTINLGRDTTVCSATDSVRIDAGAGFTHYTWSTGDTVRAIKARAGSYSVTATNASGCSATGQRTVSLSSRSLSLGSDIVRCSPGAATLTATPGFASYQWINRTASPSNTFSATKTGTYWVKATDSAGCSSYDTVSLRYSAVLQTNLQDTFRTCPGNLVNLDAGTNLTLAGDSIVIFYNATQGQTGLVGASKVYMHSGPEFHPFQGWQTAYTTGHFGVDDGIGRMDSLGNNQWRIVIFPQSYYGYSPDTPLNGIFMVFRNANGSATGKDNAGNDIFLNLSGPTPTCSFSGVTAIHKYAGNISYQWSNSATAPAISVGTAGVYKVTVTDNSGCSATDSTNVIISSTLSVNIGRDTTICPSGSVRFDAGAGYTHYAWSTGDTTRTITVSAAGLYSVTVANGNCTASDTARISVSGTKVNLGADITRCTTAATALTAPAGYASYQWFGTGASSITHNAVNDGCYWLKATDSAGCTSYDTICVSTSAVRGLHNRDTVTVCSGDTARFDASVNVNRVGDSIVIVYDATQGQSGLAGATKVYMHSGPEFHPFQGWQTAYTVGHYGVDDGIGQMTSLGANKWRIAIDPSCYYGFNPDTPLNGIFMVFRNANGTQSGKDAGGNDIFVYTAVTPPTCSFNGVTASRRATNAVTYSWSNGGTSAVGSFTTAGTYYVTATEGSCSKVDTVTVTVATPPSVNLGNDVCLNGGTASLNAGAGFSSYLWSTGASTQTITANQAGTYWVRVTNASGCKGSDTIVVAAAPRVSLGRDTCVASGSTVVLNAGIGYSRYNWSNGDSTQTITVTQSGTYIVTVTNTGGCTGRDTIVVSVGGLSVNAGADTCINTGGSKVLNAGAGFSSYRWSTGASTASITVTTPGVYVVTVTSASGCTGSDTVVITSCTIVNPGCKPDAKFNVVHNAASYAATFVNQSTGRAPLHFFWNYGDNTNSTDSGSSVHTYGQAGLYTVTLIVCNDTCGCDTFTAQVSITVGINEIEGLSAVNLYPNPASTNCVLSVTTTDRTEAVITVNNTLGAIIATEKWELAAGKNDRNLDLSSMAAGMYTVTLKTEAGALTRKLNIIK